MQYQVQVGDTLSDIAFYYGLTVDALWAANPQISDPNIIYVGQILTIPTATHQNPPVPQGSATVNVQVRTPNNGIGSNAMVMLVTPQGAVSYYGYADAYGNIGWANVLPGTYRLGVTLEGYLQYIGDLMSIAAGQVYPLPITLMRNSTQPVPQQPPPPSQPSAPAKLGVIVLDSATGQPINGVTVEMFASSIANPLGQWSKVTGPLNVNGTTIQGAAMFDNLTIVSPQTPAGQFLMRINRAGFQQALNPYLLNAGESYNVTISLVPAVGGGGVQPAPTTNTNMVPVLVAGAAAMALVFLGTKDVQRLERASESQGMGQAQRLRTDRWYRGVLIQPAGLNGSGIRWTARTPNGIVRADTLDGVKDLIRRATPEWTRADNSTLFLSLDKK